MSQSSLPLKTDPVAEVFILESGKLVIRPRGNNKLALTGFARTAAQIDGAWVLEPLSKEIEMIDAMEILGVPYSTLRRIIELGAVVAFKRSPGRWSLDLGSVLELKTKASQDPDFWATLKPVETSFQGDLKL